MMGWMTITNKNPTYSNPQKDIYISWAPGNYWEPNHLYIYIHHQGNMIQSFFWAYYIWEHV